MSDTKTVVALVGNPNCGKTTLFNELTGSNYDVGNRIGVTVESKKGICRYNKNMLIVDLPGIYSLSPNSAEEIITHDFIINEKPDLIPRTQSLPYNTACRNRCAYGNRTEYGGRS